MENQASCLTVRLRAVLAGSGSARSWRTPGSGRPFEGCERLEGRQVLTAVSWTGDAGDNLWHTPGNWDTNSVPTIADDVTIDAAADPVIEFSAASGDRAVNSLVLREDIFISGGSLSVVASATMEGDAQTTLAGGTLLLAGASTISDLALTGGTLTGSGELAVLAAFAWTGGTMSGAGKTIVAASAAFSGPGTNTVLALARTLELGGDGVLSNGSIEFTDGTLAVLPGGTLMVAGGGTPFVSGGGANALVVGGTLVSSGTGTAALGVPLTILSGGLLGVHAGTLLINSGGVNAGTLDVNAGAVLTLASGVTHQSGSLLSGAGTINFSGGTHILAAGSFSPSGAVRFSGASVTNNSAWALSGSVSISGGALNQNAPATFQSLTVSGGTLAGSGQVTINSVLAWTGGTMTGLGRTVVAASGSFVGPASGGSVVLGRPLDLVGIGTIGDGAVTLVGGVVVVRAGGLLNITMAGNALVRGSGNTSLVVESGGAVQKMGAGLATIGVTLLLQPGGRVDVQEGTLGLSGTGTVSGTLNIGQGAAAVFTSNFTFAAGGLISGIGAVVLSTGTQTMTGSYTVAGAVTVATSLTGTGNLTVTGSLSWTGGTMSGTGRTIVAESGLFTGPAAGGSATLSRTLEIGGTGTLANGISMANGTLSILSGGTLNVSATDNVVMQTGGTNAVLVYTGGRLHKVGAGTATLGVPLTVQPGGTFDVQGGTLIVSAQIAHSGATHIAATATLSIAGGGSFSAWYSLTGSGSVNINSTSSLAFGNGTMAFDGRFLVAGHVQFNAAVTIATLRLTGGSLGGTGNVTISGDFSWAGGNMTGPGKTIVAATGAMVVQAATTSMQLTRTLELAGHCTLAHDPFFPLGMSVGGTILVAAGGVLSTAVEGYSIVNGMVRIASGGTLVKAGETLSTFSSNLTVEPGGVVDVQRGTLMIDRTGTNSGTMNIATGATLRLNQSFTLAPSGTVGNAGTLHFSGGAQTIEGFYSIAGAIIVQTNVTGPGDLTVTGSLALSGGVISGTGTTTIAASATFTGPAAGQSVLLTRVLRIAGVGTLANPNLYLTNGTISVLAGGTLRISAEGNAIRHNAGTNSVQVAAGGSLTKIGKGPSSIGVPISNNGLLSVESGSLSVSSLLDNAGSVSIAGGTLEMGGGGSHSGGFAVGPGAAISLAGTHTFSAAANVSGEGALSIAGGSSSFAAGIALGSADFVAGTATFHGGFSLGPIAVGAAARVIVRADSSSGGSVTNAGTLDIGTRILHIAGDYTQASEGTLELKIDGPAAGHFGRLEIAGTAELAGTLSVTWDSPPATVAFPFISARRRVGTFGTVLFPQPGGPPLVGLVYGPTGVTLQVAAPKVAVI